MAEVATPLLEQRQQRLLYENCPGCQLELKKVKAKGVPKKELFFLAILVLSNVLPISSLFPYIYFLVRDFHAAKSDANIGIYAGFIGSAFLFGRFTTSALWGHLSDKYGRKLPFYVGSFSIIIFMTMFGFSTNIWMAMITRFLLGAFNGILGPARAYASELCDKEHQALGLSLVATMWGLGLIIGPALGGYLAQPSIKYPTIFPAGTLFDKFQYALPSLCISVFSALALPFVFMLPESLHKHHIEVIKYVPECGGEKNHSEVMKENNVSNATVSAQVNSNRDCEDQKSMKTESIWRNRGLAASITMYCLWGLHDMAYSEIFSLWSVSPSKYGGLNFSTSQVGNVLAISGGIMLTFQILLFAPLAKNFGAIIISRVPAMLTVPLVAAYPLITQLNGLPLMIAITSASALKSILSSCITTGSFMMINNSVKMEQRGLANGISMTGMSLFKGVGPACAGTLFSWAQTRLDASILPGNWMTFFILDCACILAIIFTFEPLLPRSVNQPMEDEADKDLQLKRARSFNL